VNRPGDAPTSLTETAPAPTHKGVARAGKKACSSAVALAGKPVSGLVWLRLSGGREPGKGGGEFKEREGWLEWVSRGSASSRA